jgi:hypothetical protein
MFESCRWLCFTPLFPQIRPLSFLQLELINERREPREQQNQVPTATDFTKSTPKSKLSHRAIRVIRHLTAFLAPNFVATQCKQEPAIVEHTITPIFVTHFDTYTYIRRYKSYCKLLLHEHIPHSS